MCNKEKLKKYIFVFVFFLMACMIASIGVLIAISMDILHKNHPAYFNINPVTVILMAIVATWLSIIFHELSHVVCYCLTGINPYFLYIFPFCIFLENEKIKIRIAFNPIIGIGGINIPNISKEIVDRKLSSLRKAMSYSLLTAPMFSLLFAVLSVLSIEWIQMAPIGLQPYYFVFFFTCIVVNFYIVLISLIPIPGIVGDFIAFWYIRHDKYFFLNQAYNLTRIQADANRSQIRKSNVLYSFALDTIEKNEINNCNNIPKLSSIFPDVIREWILNGHNFDERLDHIATRILSLEELYFSNHLGNPTVFECFCYMIIYLSFTDRLTTALSLWNKNIEQLPNHKEVEYYATQAKIAMRIMDNHDNIPEIKLSPLDSLFSLVGTYYSEEQRFNQLLESYC